MDRLKRQDWEQYLEMTDEQLIEQVRLGDDTAQDVLFDRYKNFVRSKAKSYFLIGADREDIIQEGMIGLYKAIRDYKADKQSPFRAFAELCITRQMITAIKSATRQKHIPLNSYISLNKPVYEEDNERSLMDILTTGYLGDPEQMMIGRESYEQTEKKIHQTLSSFELCVLNCYLSGKSYQEIALELGRPTKSIDNALQRVKRKLEKTFKGKRNDHTKVI